MWKDSYRPGTLVNIWKECSCLQPDPWGALLPLQGGVLKIQASYQSQWRLTTGLCLGVDQHFSPRVGYTRWGQAD